MSILVDRCICKDIRFSELKDLAAKEQISEAVLRERTGCGAECGTCRPYIRRMLATGEVHFTELLPPDPSVIRDN